MLVALCLAPVQLQRQHEAHVPAWLLPPVLLLSLHLREGSSSMEILNPVEQVIAAWPLWTRLVPTVIGMLAWGIWSTKERVR